jgi:hypothetical protein
VTIPETTPAAGNHVVTSLYDQLTAATAPSRDLDLAIAKGLYGRSMLWKNRYLWMIKFEETDERGRISTDSRILPDFTSSVDAALTALPDDWTWELVKHSPGVFQARLTDPERKVSTGCGASASLALWAARFNPTREAASERG